MDCMTHTSTLLWTGKSNTTGDITYLGVIIIIFIAPLAEWTVVSFLSQFETSLAERKIPDKKCHISPSTALTAQARRTYLNTIN